MRWRGIAAAVILSACSRAVAQTNGAPAFEVATIKPTDPAFSGQTIDIPSNDSRMSMRGFTLKDLIRFAWGVDMGLSSSMITGGPDWCSRDRYDVVAKAGGDRLPSIAERRLMFQILLADRFHLVLKREPRDMPAYLLVIASAGPRMKTRRPDDGGDPFSLRMTAMGHVPGRDASMDQLAHLLQSGILNRPVVNKTDLAGTFDFELTWTPDESQDSDLPNLFTAIQEQRGLKPTAN